MLATYRGTAKSYWLATKQFTPGVPTPIDPAEHKLLKGDPNFTFEDATAAEVAALVQEKEEKDTRPKLPANGFLTKADALAFAKTHFEAELNENTNLKALNEQVEALWDERYAPAKDEEDAVEI